MFWIELTAQDEIALTGVPGVSAVAEGKHSLLLNLARDMEPQHFGSRHPGSELSRPFAGYGRDQRSIGCLLFREGRFSLLSYRLGVGAPGFRDLMREPINLGPFDVENRSLVRPFHSLDTNVLLVPLSRQRGVARLETQSGKFSVTSLVQINRFLAGPISIAGVDAVLYAERNSLCLAYRDATTNGSWICWKPMAKSQTAPALDNLAVFGAVETQPGLVKVYWSAIGQRRTVVDIKESSSRQLEAREADPGSVPEKTYWDENMSTLGKPLLIETIGLSRSFVVPAGFVAVVEHDRKSFRFGESPTAKSGRAYLLLVSPFDLEFLVEHKDYLIEFRLQLKLRRDDPEFCWSHIEYHRSHLSCDDLWYKIHADVENATKSYVDSRPNANVHARGVYGAEGLQVELEKEKVRTRLHAAGYDLDGPPTGFRIVARH